jgi:type VI secretion system protein ImpL
VTLGKQDDKVDKALDAAADIVRRKRDEMMKMFGQAGDSPAAARTRPESIIDDHFAPLRRMVTAAAPGQPAPIDAMAALMNDMYTHLVNTEAAMNAGSPPPPSDVPNKIKAEAGRMPEPLQSILTSFAQSATQQVFDKTRTALSKGFATSIGDFCKKALDGRYPFVKSSKLDVTQDDFARLFAPGGLFDEFFQKNLAPHVDTTVKPWTFKSAAEVTRKPSDALVQFQRAQAIREVFFRGGQRAALKFDLKPVSLDPSITQLVIDIDGQVLTYGPGQQAPASVQWPGPKGASQVRLQVTPATTAAAQVYEGPWALFRMLDRAQIQPTAQPEKLLVTFNADGRKAQFELISASVQNPLRLPELEQFRCPAQL